MVAGLFDMATLCNTSLLVLVSHCGETVGENVCAFVAKMSVAEASPVQVIFAAG